MSATSFRLSPGITAMLATKDRPDRLESLTIRGSLLEYYPTSATWTCFSCGHKVESNDAALLEESKALHRCGRVLFKPECWCHWCEQRRAES